MADNIRDMDAHRKLAALEKRVESGGGPPHNGEMEARLAKLEATIPTLATKEDLMKLRGETREGFESVRGEMHKGTAEIIKWMVGLTLALGAAAVTIMTFVLNNAVPKIPAATPAPIVIQVPAAPPAPKP